MELHEAVGDDAGGVDDTPPHVDCQQPLLTELLMRQSSWALRRYRVCWCVVDRVQQRVSAVGSDCATRQQMRGADDIQIRLWERWMPGGK